MGVDEDRQWVEEVTGGTVTRFDRTTAGKSRATWLVDVQATDGSVAELVLRRDTGDGPLSGTELSLERETVVYAALGSTGVRAPRLLGVAPDRQALLVERIAGTEELAGLGEGERDAVLLDFIDALADLHLVDVATLDLPGISRPTTPQDHARCELTTWRGVFDQEVKRPVPLLHLVFRWLDANAPTTVERTVLCHGDLGPGNFMHADGRVTALLDWEFAHLGDPMDDLAWLSMRGSQVAGLTTLAPLIARYVERTGFTIDPDRVGYYRILVLARMAVACLVGLERRSGAMDASTYFALLPLLERQLTALLAERTGVTVAAVERPAGGSPTARSEVIDTILSDVGSVFAPELQSEAARGRLMGTFLLLSHLQAAELAGREVEAAELADLAVILGDVPESIDAGRRALAARIDSAAIEELPDLLVPLARQADRALALWPAVAAFAERPMLPIEAP